MNKIELYEHCINLLEEKQLQLKRAIDQAQQSVNAEEKSTAGDKHETSREIARQEVEKIGIQYQESLSLLDLATKIGTAQNNSVVQLGNLVETNMGVFYLLVAIGKIEFDNKAVFVLSAQSPLGKQFIGKQRGDIASFNGKSYEIQKIV